MEVRSNEPRHQQWYLSMLFASFSAVVLAEPVNSVILEKKIGTKLVNKTELHSLETMYCLMHCFCKTNNFTCSSVCIENTKN